MIAKSKQSLSNVTSKKCNLNKNNFKFSSTFYKFYFMKVILSIMLIFTCFQMFSQSNDIQTAQDLVQRIAPDYSSQIVFIQKEASNFKDYYELRTEQNQLFITANNANSMAVGFNEYLQKYCHVTVSWYVNDQIALPQVMPIIPMNERTEARVSQRFFLNYCTFGYTMTWWNWQDWERFIDWMALNGVNLPLAITGQEKVWLDVWKQFGLKDEEIRSYFTGPAYLPWHRMSNIDHWEGPLPMSWINAQAELQQKIVDRERAFNMKPVLPAFAGHVPQALKRIYPDINITSLGEWGDFDQEYQSYFLDSFDPLFAKIQKAYLEAQTKRFGTDHIYGIDPFNEVTPPSWEPEYLASVSNNLYQSLTNVDPDATWLQMTWIFFFARHNWTNERIEAFLKAVPQDKMLLLDYYCENTEVWKQTESYFGQPYIWSYLGNFGGNTVLEGNLKDIDTKIEHVIQQGGPNLRGLGATLEGFGNNRMIYEYVLEKAWKNTNSSDYAKVYAQSVSGQSDIALEQAWHLMEDKIYNGISDVGHGDLTNSKPVMEHNYNWTVRQEYFYDNKDLLKVWELMLQSDAQTDTYYFDLTSVGKQVLGNYFPIIRDKFAIAFYERDEAKIKELGASMLQLMYDIDRLLAANANTLLGEWLEDAKSMGENKNEQDYYEANARRIITTWGGEGRGLNDYANRSIAGLMRDYYAARWQIFVNEVLKAVQNGEEYSNELVIDQVDAFAWEWTSQHQLYNAKPVGSTKEISRELFNTYAPLILEGN